MSQILRFAHGKLNLKKICLPSVSAQNLQVKISTSQASGQKSEDFFGKNDRLKRPLSPHLTIYKLQITSVLSVTHRGTGIALATALYGFSASMLLLPGSFPYYFEILQNMHINPAFIFATKFALAWTFCFHAANGMRHLAWDFGYGFELNQLTISGYIVLGTALALATLAALK